MLVRVRNPGHLNRRLAGRIPQSRIDEVEAKHVAQDVERRAKDLGGRSATPRGRQRDALPDYPPYPGYTLVNWSLEGYELPVP